MIEITLSGTTWTEIVAPGGTADVDIRSRSGMFRLSIGAPSEIGAATISAPPVPQGGAWARQQVRAGIPVYAKALSDSAIAVLRHDDGHE